jgi:hypothetical protein
VAPVPSRAVTHLLTGPRTPREDGPAGNERLTAWTGALLFVLLAAEGVTILAIGTLTVPHIVVGMVLLGPVALKVASTGYRFVRYYTGQASYRRAGPPAPALRVLGPVVVVSTVAVLASGVALLLVPRADQDLVFTLHKASFIVWFGATSLHVLAYLWRVPRLISSELGVERQTPVPRHRVLRLTALAGSLAVGVVLAAATFHLTAPWSHGAQLGG